MREGRVRATQGRRAGRWTIPGMLLVIVSALLTAGSMTPAQASGGGGNGPSLTISAPVPPRGPAGTHVIASASLWVPGTTITVSIGSTSGCANTTAVDGATAQVNTTGSAQIAFTPGAEQQNHPRQRCGDMQ